MFLCSVGVFGVDWWCFWVQFVCCLVLTGGVSGFSWCVCCLVLTGGVSGFS